MAKIRNRLIVPLVAATAMLGMGMATAAANGSASYTDRGAPTQALRAELNQYLAARGTTEHASAVSVRVTYPGDRPGIDATVGTTQYGGTTPVPRHAEWQTGSNGKAFTSVLLLQLEAEGKLSIHDTLGTWLPQYPAWRDITITQLLDMTSGIPDYSNQDAFVAALTASLDTVFTPAQLVSYVVGLPLGPTTFSYSNTNYVLAQLIIERAGHDTYAHQLARRVIAPLGLRDTCFAPAGCAPGTARRMPTGYVEDSSVPTLVGRPVPALNLTVGQGSGALVSSLADQTTWERALYTGRMLPPRQQHELEGLISTRTSQPIDVTTATDPVGFGLGIAQLTRAGTGTVWYFEGETLGFRVVHIYDPKTGVTVIVAVNSSFAAHGDGLPGLAFQALQTVKDGPAR